MELTTEHIKKPCIYEIFNFNSFYFLCIKFIVALWFQAAPFPSAQHWDQPYIIQRAPDIAYIMEAGVVVAMLQLCPVATKMWVKQANVLMVCVDEKVDWLASMGHTEAEQRRFILSISDHLLHEEIYIHDNMQLQFMDIENRALYDNYG